LNSPDAQNRKCAVALLNTWAPYEDIQPSVDFIEACDQKNQSHLYDWQQLDILKRLGYLAQARYSLKAAELAATYRDVSALIKNYEKYSNLGGTEINEVAAHRFLALGKIHADPEKSCPLVDMRDQLGPIRNQGQTGYCFAFAVADVMSRLLGKRVSAWDIDLTYRGDQLRQLVSFRSSRLARAAAYDDGGSINQAFVDAQKKGVCLESSLPSEYASQSGGLDQVIKGIEKLRTEAETTASKKNFDTSCEKNINPVLSDLTSAAKISNLAQVVAQSTLSDAIYGIDAQACDGHRIKIPQEYRIDLYFSLPSSPNPQQLEVIDSELNHKNPMLIGYNADILSDRHKGASDSPHASIIVGRQFDRSRGQCDYIIRNSWGKDCSEYDPYYKCQDGNVWVPKENLEQAMYATYAVHSNAGQ
jgi:C1A family cysteine protease